MKNSNILVRDAKQMFNLIDIANKQVEALIGASDQLTKILEISGDLFIRLVEIIRSDASNLSFWPKIKSCVDEVVSAREDNNITNEIKIARISNALIFMK